MQLGALLRQKEIYSQGAAGLKPLIPTDFTNLERQAKAKLSDKAYTYLAGGAGLECTLQNNRSAFEDIKIIPRMLSPAADRSSSVSVLGQSYVLPFFFCPIGVLELAHRLGDLELARSCRETGVPMMVSNQASYPMEQIALELGSTAWYFQLYVSKSLPLSQHLIKRAEDAGAKGIVITVDTTQLGWRPRDLNLAHLPFLEGKGIAQYTSDHVFQQLVDQHQLAPATSPVNVQSISHLLKLIAALPGKKAVLAKGRALKIIQTFTQIYTRQDLDWKIIDQLKSSTRLPVFIKGIQHSEDAKMVLDSGLDGIYVSNHGGRQIDGALASLHALKKIKSVVNHKIPVLFDSGVRCGADIVKALALGADFVGIGRPYVFALALAGKEGVTELTKNLAAEMELTMNLAGIQTLQEIQLEG